MYSLDSQKLHLIVIGAIMVIAGVVLKNSNEQMGQANAAGGQLGALLFVAGWAAVAYSIAMSGYGNGLQMNNRTYTIFACAAAIVISVFIMKAAMAKGQSPQMIYPILFAAAWLLLGYMAGTSANTQMLGVGAAVLVLLSMMWALPWQRANCIVDGPGMPLFVAGWALLAFVNSVNNF